MLWKKDETRKLETVVKFKLTMQFGGPAVGQKDPQHFCSTRTQVCSPAQHRGLKDPALLQLGCRSHLQLGFSPWPGNFHMLQVWPLKGSRCDFELLQNSLYKYYVQWNSNFIIGDFN